MNGRKGNGIKTPFFYGWMIVAVGALGVFFSGPGQTYSNAIFIDYYINDFGWSRSLVSTIYSIATLAAGLLMMVVGKYIDKYGQRFFMIFVTILLALACFWNSFVTNIVMLAIGFFMIRLFGQGSMTLLPNTLIPQWFIEKRGRAFSFMAIGGFLSSALFPIINLWAIDLWGWEITWRFWGVLLLIIFLPIVVVFVKNKPEDVGLTPDNKVALKEPEGGSDKNKVVYESSWTLAEAKKTRTFWFLLCCVGIPSMVNTGLTFHLVSIFGENDLSPQLAATVLSAMALVGFPITFLSGFILERIEANYMLFLTFIGEILVLILAITADSFFLALLFGVLWGFFAGIERIALNVIWPNFFGREHIGSIKGLAMSITVIGSAFGPLPFGIAFDLFNGYNEILYATMIFPLVGCLLAWKATKPSKEHNEKNL
ncbi:MFS transporter, partial [Metabacillus halosaccharovorans]